MHRLARRVMVAVAGMAVLGMTATPAGAQTNPAPFTLNDVMQAPFAWAMLAASKGAAVAWVFSAKDCSNIWVADPSQGAKARQITKQAERARCVSRPITAVLIDGVSPFLLTPLTEPQRDRGITSVARANHGRNELRGQTP